MPLTKLVFQTVESAMGSREDMMKGPSHIATISGLYLGLKVSPVLQRGAGEEGVPLRRMVVNLFSMILEYQVRSVISSQHPIASSIFHPKKFSDLLSQLKDAESYFDGKAELFMQAEVLRLRELKHVEHRQAMIRSVIQQFRSSEATRVTSEEENGIAEDFVKGFTTSRTSRAGEWVAEAFSSSPLPARPILL